MRTKTKPKKRVAILEPRSSKRPLRKIDDLPPSLQEPARQALIGFVAYAQQRRAGMEMVVEQGREG